MEYRKLGRTGLKVSPLCLGTVQWGWTADEQSATEVMDAFIEAGGNFLDTADVYPQPVGISEEIIGRWMKERGNRSQIVVATKVRSAMGTGPNDQGLSRKHIMDAVDASLRRLQTDYIDLYQTHAPDTDTPIDETLRTLDGLVRTGKVRSIGASNYSAWRLMEALWSADTNGTMRYDSLQPHYNLVHRSEFERELKAVCERYDIGVIPYSPLATGFLTGKYTRDNVPESSRAEGVRQRYFTDYGWGVLDAVTSMAKEVECSPSAIALAWQLSKPVITAPIIGANTIAQLQASLDALAVQLTRDQLDRLDRASAWENGRA